MENDGNRLTKEQRAEFERLKKEAFEKAELEAALIQIMAEAGSEQAKGGEKWAKE